MDFLSSSFFGERYIFDSRFWSVIIISLWWILFSWDNLFIGRLGKSIGFISIPSKLLQLLMIIYLTERLVWFVDSSILNKFLSYRRIMISTFSLNVSLYKWLFYRVTETSSCLSTDSLLNFILRSSNYIVHSKSYRFNLLFSVKVFPHLVICFHKFF